MSFALILGFLLPISEANAAACAVTESTFIGDGTNSTESGRSYYVVTITDRSGCNWSIPSNVASADILSVGGGGGGGGGAGYFAGGNGGGGGGGAGEIEVNFGVSLANVSSLTIQVGSGGNAGSGGGSGQVGSTGSNGTSSSITEVGITANGGGGAGGGANTSGGAGGTSGNGKLGGSGSSSTPWAGGSGGSSTLNGSNASTIPVTGTSIYFTNLSTTDSFAFGGGASACNAWGTKSSALGSGGYGGRGALYSQCGNGSLTYSYGYSGTAGNHGVIVIRYWVQQVSGGWYCPPPSIDIATPTFGSSEGGELVTINGNFLGKDIFLGEKSLDPISATDEKIVFKTPASAKGISVIEIVNRCNKSTKIDFMFDPDPVLTDYTKSKISTSGDFFTAGGKYLLNATATINGESVKVLTNSDSFIKLSLPGMSEGVKSLQISTKYGSTIVPVTYLAPPTISSRNFEEYFVKGDSISLKIESQRSKLFILSGPLPEGLTLNSNSGLISGTALKDGLYPFKVTVINEVGVDSASFEIKIDKSTPRNYETNVYFKFRSDELTEMSTLRLKELLEKLRVLQPNQLRAAITISIGSDLPRKEILISRKKFLESMFEKAGINVRNFEYVGGNPYRANVAISWNRNSP